MGTLCAVRVLASPDDDGYERRRGVPLF